MRIRAWGAILSLAVTAAACGDQLTEPSPDQDAAPATIAYAVAGAERRLAFGQQPTTTISTQPMSPPVTVRVLDGANALVGTSTVPVTLAFGNNFPGGTLSGTLTRNAVNGVATFPDLSIDKTGGYTLRASSPGLEGAGSAAFSVLRGPAARLAFTAQPSGGEPGQPFAGQPRVAVQDAGGNLISSGSGSSSKITLAVEPGTGTGGATLGCAVNPLTATAGTAAFSGCAIDLAGRSYRLRATSGTLAAAGSDPFDVGAPNRAPVVDAGGPYTASEGAALTLAPDVTDPDGDPLTYRWSVAAVGLDPGGQCTFDDPAARNATITCTDDSEGAAGGQFTLTLEASDGIAAAVAASASITLANVAPAIGGIAGAGTSRTALPATVLVGGTVDLEIWFGDEGANDSHTAAVECETGAGFASLGEVTSPLAAGCTFATVGPRTIRVRVTDDDGGSTVAGYAVTVVYGVEGFFAPVARPNTLNPYRAGQVVPLKWRLTDAFGNPIETLSGVTVRAAGLACSRGTTTDQVEEYAAGSSGLENLGRGYYRFNWKTPPGYAGSCKRVALMFGTDPGSYIEGPHAYFTFKP